MSIQIKDYSFEGIYSLPSHLEEEPGVFVVICQKYEKNEIVDIGESDNVKSRVENNERSNCWRRNCESSLAYAVLYTSDLTEKERRDIVYELRDEYNPVCGREL
jgi:hypothetical protein